MGVLTDQPNSFWVLSQGTGVSGLPVPDWLLVLLVPVSLAWVQACAFCPTLCSRCSQPLILGPMDLFGLLLPLPH